MTFLLLLGCVDPPTTTDDTAVDSGPETWYLAFRSVCPGGALLSAQVAVFDDPEQDLRLSGSTDAHGGFCGLVPLEPNGVYRVEWTVPGAAGCFAGEWGITQATHPDWWRKGGCPEEASAVWTAESCDDPDVLESCWG